MINRYIEDNIEEKIIKVNSKYFKKLFIYYIGIY